MSSVEYNRRYRIEHADEIRAQRRRKRLALKIECFEHYGGCICAIDGCTISDPALLELDHIDGNGNKDRAERIGLGLRSPGGWNFYSALKRAGWPPGFRVICTQHHDEKHGRTRKEDNEQLSLDIATPREYKCSPGCAEDRFDDLVPF